MNERRGDKRRQPEGELSVRVKALLPARVMDISLRGMQVELSSLLRVGVPCEVKMRLEGEDLGLLGTVQWCRADRFGVNEQGEKVLYYRAGLAFAQVGEGVWERLEKVVGGDRSAKAGVEVAEQDVLLGHNAPPEAPSRRQGPIKVKVDTTHWSPKSGKED